MSEFESEFEPDPEECANCGYATDTELYPFRTSRSAKIRLCDICSGTHFSLATEYPQQVEDVLLYKSLAYLGNMILARLDTLIAM